MSTRAVKNRHEAVYRPKPVLTTIALTRLGIRALRAAARRQKMSVSDVVEQLARDFAVRVESPNP